MRKSEIVGIVLIVFILAVGFFMIGVNYQRDVQLDQPAIPITVMENMFVDMDGDGYEDYVYRAEVVVNPGVPLP